MIKAVLFDLDGTLLNRDASVQHFITNQYKRLDSLHHLSKDSYITRFIELDNRGYVWKDKVYQQLVKEFEITGLSWEALLEDYISQFQFSCVPFPHLKEALEILKQKGFALGMISNGKGQFQMDNIKALGIEPYFNTILISEWEGMKKPDPRIFQKALQQLHVQPQQGVFVGDHPENDVLAAQRIGMQAIWKKDKGWKNCSADWTVDDLKEILSIASDNRVV
ncbi:HAD family hydrolase [Gracilibacillus caseinilyticus]|uniref:HAD family hydrolase n=1 Tax=Gracilibacillus caseinilyticus TaxID=2932256 RepID=A0ABY4EW58_9BACI|nr:HAD family hydrolase [Gracilibacillus caseinilyticus]UOQ48651.1 HAD family hydrolase [Gracilibacillus caseinilyticus]